MIMITRLRLQNFKSFRDATLELGPCSLLVGANASGKSNLRDAFRFLHGIGRGYTLTEIIGEKRIEGEKVWGGIRGGLRGLAFQDAETFALEVSFSQPAAALTPNPSPEGRGAAEPPSPLMTLMVK
jgi:predicted ATPase